MVKKNLLTITILIFIFITLRIIKSQETSNVIWSKDVPELCYAVQVSPDGITFANSDGQSLQIRNLVDGSLIRQFGEHDNEKINSIRFSPDGKFVFTGAGEFHINPVRVPYVKMWDISNGNLIKKFESDNSSDFTFIKSFDLSKDGKQLAAIILATNDVQVFVWDVNTGKIIKKLTFPKDTQPSCIKYSPTDDYIVLCTAGNISLYSYPQIKFVSRIDNYFNWHQSYISAMAITSDGKIIASTDNANVVKIWDVDKLAIVKTINFEKIASPTYMQFDNSNDYLLSMTSIPQILNLESGTLINPYDKYNPDFLGVEFDITNNNDLIIAGLTKVKLLKGIYGPNDIVEPTNMINNNIYPNPVNNIANIDFILQKNEKVKIDLLNIDGKLLKSIFHDYYSVGLNTVKFDCSNLSSGSYYIKINSSSFSKTYKLIKEN